MFWIVELFVEGRVGDVGELYDVVEDDDVELRRLVVELMCLIEEEFVYYKLGLVCVNNGSFGSCFKLVLVV